MLMSEVAIQVLLIQAAEFTQVALALQDCSLQCWRYTYWPSSVMQCKELYVHSCGTKVSLSSMRSLTQAAGVTLSGVHVVPSSLHSSICKVAVAMAEVGCKFLCPRHKPLAQNAMCAQECSKTFILRNVVPSFPHQVNAQLKLCSNDVIIDILDGIKQHTGSTCDVQSKMGAILKIFKAVCTSGETFVCIPGMVKNSWMLQKDTVVLHSMECKERAALEGGLTLRTLNQVCTDHT